ncbi:MAG TPA: rod shape-determining protein MreC [Acidimicrobiales bacterium]
MPYSRRTGRSRFTLILLVLGSLTLLVVGLPGNGPIRPVRSAFGTIFSPFRSAGNFVFKPVADGWHGMWGYDDVKKDNQRLRREIDQRKGDAARVAELQKQVKELSQLNHVSIDHEPLVGAEVTSGPLSSFDRTITINVGSGKGVKHGQAVITVGGLVGRIDRVDASSSTVTLLTEPSFDVGIRLTRLGEIGSAEGQGQRRPLLIDDGIGVDVKIRKGDRVTTSGLDTSFFPPGEPIGRVTGWHRSSDGTQLLVSVRPLVNLSSVSYVKVVLREPQQ